MDRDYLSLENFMRKYKNIAKQQGTYEIHKDDYFVTESMILGNHKFTSFNARGQESSDYYFEIIESPNILPKDIENEFNCDLAKILLEGKINSK